MDLDMSAVLFCRNGHVSSCDKNDNSCATTLNLVCSGNRSYSAVGFGASQINTLPLEDDGCTLVLGLGPTPSFYSKNSTPVPFAKVPSMENCSQSLSNHDSGILELGLCSSGGEPSRGVENNHSNPSSGESLYFPIRHPHIATDEGSTSARNTCGGYMPSLLLAPRLDADGSHRGMLEPKVVQNHIQFSSEPSGTTDCSLGGISDTKTIDTCCDNHHPKKCRFRGCSKGARGASGLCIAHGGGQRCQKLGCNKGAESRTAFCKAHGGGRRCQELGCTKSAEGKTDYCIAHGGGRRCGHVGCTKAARGKSGLCIRHGGGKRCKMEGCTRSAEGQAGLCISHGGGRRCQFLGCTKGAQGSTIYCKGHGGGKRCIFEGCTKGAEGSTPLCKGHGGGKRCLYEGGGVCPKSVHGGTDYCVAHGGGKRCVFPGCTKSARGRTDCCVRHGGGKRCKHEGCAKSAQGSTDFCKAHGGGKRCNWPSGCEKFARGRSGLCAAHTSAMAMHKGLEGSRSGSMLGHGIFNGIVSVSTTIGSNIDYDYTSSGVSASAESLARTTQFLIPPQVLVPSSMKSFCSEVPEGRVHGGGIMSLLGGNFHNVSVNLGDDPV